MAKDLKPHIGIFGKRNCGKSSLINALTGQDTAIVSEQSGTTTDPVKKSVEIFGIGPVIIVDTAGIDDTGELGKKRIRKSLAVISQIDLAILVFSNNNFDKYEKELIKTFKENSLAYVLVYNKSDIDTLSICLQKEIENCNRKKITIISALKNNNIQDLIDLLIKTIPKSAYIKPSLFEGLIKENSKVLLVTPIDSEAPEGRMILPQVMAIRDVLDKDSICIVLKETQLKSYIDNNTDIDLVVTDSQAFEMVSAIVPLSIPLTSFSIIFSRIKAHWEPILKGTKHISKLNDGDNVLILESCTHHVSCEDIGRYKIPKWLTKFTGKDLNFDIVSGLQEFEEKLDNCAMVIQCGGCVATQKQIKNRLQLAINKDIAVSNYGMAIAYTTGVFERATEIFN